MKTSMMKCSTPSKSEEPNFERSVFYTENKSELLIKTSNGKIKWKNYSRSGKRHCAFRFLLLKSSKHWIYEFIKRFINWLWRE